MTNVRFSADKMRVISTGGADHAIFQWRFRPDGIGEDDDLPDQHGESSCYFCVSFSPLHICFCTMIDAYI